MMPENDLQLRRWASAIRRRGLRLPALVALEAGQPLGFLLGQFLWMAQPALSLLWSPVAIGQVAVGLEGGRLIEALIRELEAE